MQLGMIGLGRMGASMVWRLPKRGHACVVHDVQPSSVGVFVKVGATGAVSPKQMVSQLGQPRTIWLTVPAAVVDRVLDGGNSYFRDEVRRGSQLQARSAALFARSMSRGSADFANRSLSAMRYEFDGHVEKPAS